MTHVHVYHGYKERAIKLRKEGKTYSEILLVIPVAKSTLSLWLHEVCLAKRQKQRITIKKLAAGARGGLARKLYRIEKTKLIHELAEKEILSISNRELWLIGISLYWAEGSKEKDHHPGTSVQFINSDYRMIQIFLLWLKKCACVPEKEISFTIHIHENNKYRIEEIKKFWSKMTNIPLSKFQNIQYKKHNIRSHRYNQGLLYYGCLRVRVMASSILNRKIEGWIGGIMKNL